MVKPVLTPNGQICTYCKATWLTVTILTHFGGTYLIPSVFIQVLSQCDIWGSYCICLLEQNNTICSCNGFSTWSKGLINKHKVGLDFSLSVYLY